MPKGIYERKKKPAEERFWFKVNKQTGNDCWEWTSSLFQNGYGQFRVDGRVIKAHRFSYELLKGPIPDDMCILHSCDNRKCCNPDHLSVGTRADNMKDMKNKNRQAKGSKVSSAKLTEFKVKEIRNKLILGLSIRKIAKEYGVNNSTISYIKTGKTWAHIE